MNKNENRPLFPDTRTRLAEKTGYLFHDATLLQEALTHSTYAYEHRQRRLASNERLEFLGDAILDLVISEYLFKIDDPLSEGTMTRTRALIVCENTLSRLAVDLGIGDLLLMGKGEEATGGREKASNLANAVEAILGAIFLDAGYDRVRSVILHLLAEALRQALTGKIVYDYKSRLLELAQSARSQAIHFAILDEQGPVHERVFTAGIYLRDKLLAKGSGSSKKDAEQQAARDALAILEKNRTLLEG